MSTPLLFEPPSSFDRARLAAALKRLSAANVFIGTSSWKYEGWIGQIYTRERYLTRGRFSERYFTSACLAEYGETFPIVCGDFSFYQFPSQAYWERLFRSAPGDLKYAFKAPEDVTAKVFPAHARYGAKGGTENPSFLNARLFEDAFLGAMEAYRGQVALLIFEFGNFSRCSYSRVGEFLADLDKFLGALPKPWRYSVEIRNPEYLTGEYFECLRAHGVAHVFNAWTRMPSLERQIALPEARTATYSVCRALLGRGRSYEQAVKAFSPYEKVQQPNPEARRAMRTLIQSATERNEPAFVFVNNRLEGNAPETIQALVEDM